MFFLLKMERKKKGRNMKSRPKMIQSDIVPSPTSHFVGFGGNKHLAVAYKCLLNTNITGAGHIISTAVTQSTGFNECNVLYIYPATQKHVDECDGNLYRLKYIFQELAHHRTFKEPITIRYISLPNYFHLSQRPKFHLNLVHFDCVFMHA